MTDTSYARERWDPDENGQLDDIVLPAVKLFRMERMDNDHWWIGLYTEDERQIHLDITMDQAGIQVTKREDTELT